MLLLSGFCYAFVRACLLMPCCHLLGKSLPLDSRLLCLIVKLSLSHWYPGLSIPDLCPFSYFYIRDISQKYNLH